VSETATTEFEALVSRALSPVDPPDELARRMENALASITELAAGELEAWELASMRDPRNWVRPAAAVVGGTAAGVALVVLRTRRRSKARRKAASSALDLVGRTVDDAVHEARRLWR